MAEPLSSAPQAGHNGTSPVGDATPTLMNDWLAREEELAERRKELTQDTKALTREIEATGMPLKSWKSFRKIREEAGTIRERAMAAIEMLLRWDLKPRGLQASMDLSASQGSPDLNVHELKRVDNEGFVAGKEGKKRSVNPYTPATEAAQRFDTAWLRGFGEQQADIAKTMAPNAPDAANGASDPNAAEKRRGGRPKGSRNKPKLDLIDGTGGQLPN